MAPTRTLILMRHASAGGGAQRDHDRPLTPGGVQDATTAGNWMRDQLPTVDAVLCSTAVRTRQTLAATGIGAPATFGDELYGGGIDDILELIALIPESANTALVVGHAPGIPSVAFELATIARLVRENEAGGEEPTRKDPAGEDPAGEDPADQDGPDDHVEQPELAGLRYFSACAIAVLTTDGTWAGLGNRGADLVIVRHPDR